MGGSSSPGEGCSSSCTEDGETRPARRQDNVLSPRMKRNQVLLLLFSLLALGLYLLAGIHIVPYGHVGVYMRGGVPLPPKLTPGCNFRLPIVTQYRAIQTSMKTTKVEGVQCATREGVVLRFGEMEVVSKLEQDKVLETCLNFGLDFDKTWIRDRLHRHVAHVCSQHTLQEIHFDKFEQVVQRVGQYFKKDLAKVGLEIDILSLYLPNPSLPESIARSYEMLAHERAQRLVAEERQRALDMAASRERERTLLQAQLDQEVERIQATRTLVQYGVAFVGWAIGAPPPLRGLPGMAAVSP